MWKEENLKTRHYLLLTDKVYCWNIFTMNDKKRTLSHNVAINISKINNDRPLHIVEYFLKNN